MTTTASIRSAPPLSTVRRAGDLLFVSGQLPRGPGGDIVPGDIVVQARRSLANLEAALLKSGASLKDVVKVTVWLTDVAYVDGFNQAYREAFQEPYPARTLVVSVLVAGDVEVEAVALAPSLAPGRP